MNSINQTSISEIPISRIIQIRLSVIDNDTFYTNLPLINTVKNSSSGDDMHSINSRVLGVINKDDVCLTCQGNKNECPGHMGYIQLYYKILHPYWIKILIKFMKLICFNCAHFIVEITHSSQLQENVSKISSKKSEIKCYNCQARKHLVSFDKKLFYFFYQPGDSSDTKVRIYADEIYEVLSRMPETIWKRLYDVHPKNYVIDKIPVLSIPLRIVSQMMNRKTSGTEYNALYNNIIKADYAIRAEKLDKNMRLTFDNDNNKKRFEDYNNIFLSYHIIINGTTTKVLNVQSVKGTSTALTGKTGMIRGNMLGKRSGNNSRSVIKANSRIKPWEIEYPIHFCMEISQRLIVNEFNYKEIFKYYENTIRSIENPSIDRVNFYPLIEYVEKNGIKYKITSKFNENIEHGDEVYVNLLPGTSANANRQPTLNYGSINTHKIVITHDKSIGLNPSICILYNADFDGDEMNVTPMINKKDKVESDTLSSIFNNAIGYKDSASIVGMVLDSQLGLAMLSFSTCYMNRCTFSYMLGNSMLIQNIDIQEFFSQEIYHGRDLISLAFNKNFNYTENSGYVNSVYAKYIKYNPDDKKIVIKNGKLLSGVLDKSVVGQGKINSLFKHIIQKYGSKVGFNIMFKLQQISLNYITSMGASVAFQDLLIPNEYKEIANSIYSGIIAEANILRQRFINGSLLVPVNENPSSFYEKQLIAILNKPEIYYEVILKYMASIQNKNSFDENLYDPPSNNFFIAANIGSKGSVANIVQMIIGYIGQLIRNDKILHLEFSQNRSSPLTQRYNYEYVNNGNIGSNYSSGLKPKEIIPTSFKARFDIISRVLSTALSGEKNRTGSKSLENIIINNNRFVTSLKRIIQFVYGGDGMDSRKLELIKFPNIKISDAEFEKIYKFEKIGSCNKEQQKVFEKEFKSIKNNRDYFRIVQTRSQLCEYNKKFVDKLFIPINIERIINDVLALDITISKNSIDDVVNMVEQVNKFLKSFCRYYYNEETSYTKIPDYVKHSTKILKILFRLYLHSNFLITIDKIVLTQIFNEIIILYKSSLIDYASEVGIIAVQSICEMMTQELLDSATHLVQGNTKASYNRYSEITSIAPTEKCRNNRMFITLREQYVNDKEANQIFANKIEMLKFKQFVSTCKIIYEEYGTTSIESDLYMFKEFEESDNESVNTKLLIPFCFRFELNKRTMIYKNMSLNIIKNKLRLLFDQNIHILTTSENSKDIIIRIYIRSKLLKDSGNVNITLEDLLEFKEKLYSIIIRGVDGIQEVVVEENTITTLQSDGSYDDIRQYCIITRGTNLLNILEFEEVDDLRTSSNSILEMHDIFGPSVSKQIFLSEFKKTIKSNVSSRHAKVYTDEAFSISYPTCIDINGIRKRHPEQIYYCASTKKPKESLYKGSLDGCSFTLNNPSSNLMVGQVPNRGSNYNTVRLNLDFVEENTEDNNDDLINI